MSWLEDRIVQYLYRNAEGEELVYELEATQDPPAEVEGHQFVQMLPYKVNLTFKIQFERNGLIAYKYDQGNGKVRTVSATRENYEKNIGNTSGDKLREMRKNGTLSSLSKSVTTKGYKETFKKVREKRKGG